MIPLSTKVNEEVVDTFISSEVDRRERSYKKHFLHYGFRFL